MAGGDVRELLVQLRLDQTQYNKQMLSSREQLKLLQASFKAANSDVNVDNLADTLKQNLKSQLDAYNTMIDDTKKRIEELKKALTRTTPGSKDETGLQSDLTKLETKLKNAEVSLNNIKNKMDTFDADNFVEQMGEVVRFTEDLRMAWDGVIGDWAKETADRADAVNMNREQALAMVTKIAKGKPGWTEDWTEETDQFIQDLITKVPATYEEVAITMANAMQAGGQSLEDLYTFTDMMLRLEKSTDLTGDEGARHFGKFLTIMETDVSEYEGLASVIVALGNGVAATEAQIVDVAVRSASQLKAVGMQADEILGLSAAALALGMEPMAAASSLEKLAEKVGGSAEYAAKGYADFENKLKAAGLAFTDFLQLQGQMDTGGIKIDSYQAMLGMTDADFNQMMANAVQAEKVAYMLGMTVDEFATAWQGDPAATFTKFFETIGSLDEGGSESMLTLLDSLGITEIREARLARNFADVADTMMEIIGLAKQANDEAVALQQESAELFNTSESQRQMNESKTENFLQKIGDSVTEVRLGWETFWADQLQKWTKNLPEWATTGIGLVVAGLSGLTDAIDGIGSFAQGIYYTGQVYRDIKKTDWGQVGQALGPLAKGAGKVLGGAAAVIGVAELARFLYDASTDATAIQDALANLQINVDAESQKRTMQAIQEVREAAEGLNRLELSEKYGNVSNVVQMGFGTRAMVGQAIAYEGAMADKELEEIYTRYGSEIKKITEEMTANAGNDILLAELQGTLDATIAAMEGEVESAKTRYSAALGSVVDGALKQAGLYDIAASYAKKYNMLDTLLGLKSGKLTMTDAELMQYFNDLRSSGYIGDKTWNSYWSDYLYGGFDNLVIDWKRISKGLQQDMLKDAEMLTADETFAEAILRPLLDSGSFENLDWLGLSEGMQGLFGLIDMKQLAQSGAGSMEEMGKQSALGLGKGWNLNGNVPVDNVTATCNAMIDAARSVLDVHSPSRVMETIGRNVVDGLAQGVLAGKSHAVNSIKEMMLAAKAEADTLSPRINEALMMMGGGVLAGGTALGGGMQIASKGAPVINNYYSVTGSVETQQNVRRLAQQLARAQRFLNQSVGKD